MAIVFILVITIGYGVYWAFYDTVRLPKGELISQAISPDGTYTVNAYRVNGGMTVDFAVRGELIINKHKAKTKNIYWNYHESDADINWVDKKKVIINGHEIDVSSDVFDYRREN